MRAATAVETEIPAGFMAPLHAQATEETVSVLEGSMTIFAGGETARLAPGETFVVAAGVVHTFRAESPRTRALFSASTPSAGRYEDFLRAVGPTSADGWSQAEDAAAVGAIAAAAGVTLLGPPGLLPVEAGIPARAA